MFYTGGSGGSTLATVSVEFEVDNCKMATGEIPAPGVFHGDKSKDEKNLPPVEEEM